MKKCSLSNQTIFWQWLAMLWNIMDRNADDSGQQSGQFPGKAGAKMAVTTQVSASVPLAAVRLNTAWSSKHRYY